MNDNKENIVKRIAFYCCDFYPNQSGYSFAFQALVIGLSKAEEDSIIDVFTPVELNNKEELRIERVRIFRLAVSPPKMMPRFGKLFFHHFVRPFIQAKQIEKNENINKYSYCVFESIDDPLVLTALPNHILKKTIVRIHATSETEYALWDNKLFQRFRRGLIKHHLQKSIRFIASTTQYYLEFVKKWYLEENDLLIAEKRFFVIPNALLSEIARDRGCFSPPESVRHFVTLGRMDARGVNQKGFDDILGALANLSDSERTRVKLTLIGAGNDRDRLISLSQKISCVEFEFIERLPNDAVASIVASADCVILASRYEGMSMFAMEALALGAPVIYSNAGGLRMLVEGNGFSYPAGNQTELSDAIRRMLCLTQEELDSMSDQSRRIISKYSVNYSGLQLKTFSSLLNTSQL